MRFSPLDPLKGLSNPPAVMKSKLKLDSIQCYSIDAIRCSATMKSNGKPLIKVKILEIIPPHLFFIALAIIFK